MPISNSEDSVYGVLNRILCHRGELKRTHKIYKDLGVDSLEGWEIAGELEIPDGIWRRMETVGQIVDYVAQRTEEQSKT